MAEANVTQEQLSDLMKQMTDMQEQLHQLKVENVQLEAALEASTQNKNAEAVQAAQQPSGQGEADLNTGNAITADDAHKIKLNEFGYYQHSSAYYAMQEDLMVADKPSRAAKDEFLALADHEEKIIKEAKDGMLSANQIAALIRDEREPQVKNEQAADQQPVSARPTVQPVEVFNADGTEGSAQATVIEPAAAQKDAAAPDAEARGDDNTPKNVQHEKFIALIADMSDKEAAQAIQAQAIKGGLDFGQHEGPVVDAIAASLTAERAALREIKPYDTIVGGFVQSNVSTTASFGKDGYAGQTTHIQQHLKFIPSDFGAFFGNASVTQDAKANVTGGNIGVNYAANPFTVGGIKGADFIPIANLNVNFPAAGDFGAGNVSGLAGVVIKPHEGTDRTNLTLAVTSNGEFDNVTGLARFSKQLVADNDNTLTGYAQSTYNFNNEQVGVGAGLRYDRYIGNGNSVFTTLGANAANVTEDSGFSGSAQFGFAWGGAVRETPLEKALTAAVGQGNAPADLAKGSAVQTALPIEFPPIIADKAEPTRLSLVQSNGAPAPDAEQTLKLQMQEQYQATPDADKASLLDGWANSLAANRKISTEAAKQATENFLEINLDKQQQVVAEVER